MGFDLYVELIMLIDENTGLPFVYVNDERKEFSVLDFQVPIQYRKFVMQCGHWFSNYVMPFEGNHVCVDVFLEYYPDWEKAIDGYEEDGWTKEDHDEFKKALEWFSKKGNYMVSWTY